MKRKSRNQILGILLLIMAIAAGLILYRIFPAEIPADFDTIEKLSGKRITITGFFGEDVSLQQVLQKNASEYVYGRFFHLYPPGDPVGKPIILDFTKSPFPYIDQGALIQVSGKVYVSDTGMVYLRIYRYQLAEDNWK